MWWGCAVAGKSVQSVYGRKAMFLLPKGAKVVFFWESGERCVGVGKKVSVVYVGEIGRLMGEGR